MRHFSIEDGKKSADIRQIPRWARTYAMNRRALGVALFMVVFVVLFAVIGDSLISRVLRIARGTLHSPGFSLFRPLLSCVAVVLGSIYFSVPKWGGTLLEQFFERLSGEEGTAVLSPPADMRKPVWVMCGVPVLYGSCILGSVALGMLGYIPTAYMQPVSALYVVPFLLFLAYKMWSIAGPIPLLWPILYALHAILILAGAPILFTGKWTGLKMLIPIAGYGLFASLIGYLYSRYALRRLRCLARIDSGETKLGVEATDVD